jgi:hypothetical protein
MSIEAKSATDINVAFKPHNRTSFELADRVRDVLLERAARCLLDRIAYKLELVKKYGKADRDYLSSLQELAAALEKTLRFDAEGCL